MDKYKSHMPTFQLRQRIFNLARQGYSDDNICEIIEIDNYVLQKHYSKELKKARPTVIKSISNILYKSMKI